MNTTKGKHGGNHGNCGKDSKYQLYCSYCNKLVYHNNFSDAQKKKKKVKENV
jgi:hypothetical protein